MQVHDPGQAHGALIDALRRGGEVHEAVGALRQLAGPTLDDAIAFTATALFARRPSVRFPAPR
jgi:hypothetical protein